MKFCYLMDGHATETKTLDAEHLIAAVDLLERKIPVKEYQRSARHATDFSVELWADQNIARKDMSFSDLKSVYRLYPSASGHLICNDLSEALWNELHAPGMTKEGSNGSMVLARPWHGYPADHPISDPESWLGSHHSRGIDYLRYGELGARLGEKRLAEIGRCLLENADLLAQKPQLTVSQIYNLVGITHDDCVKATLVLSNEPYFTVFPYQDLQQISDHEWYDSIEEALAVTRSCMRQVDLSIYMNGEIPIGHVVDGKWYPEEGLTTAQVQQAQDSLAAFQAACLREPLSPFYDRLYFTVSNGQTPPTDIYPDFKDDALSLGIYDLTTALSAFSDNRHPNGKTLFVSYGRDIGGQCNLQHVPLLFQDPTGQLHFYSSGIPSPQSSIMAPILSACLREVFPANEMQTGKWGVKLIPPGARYGLGDSVCNDSGDTLVEFYDRSQDPTKFPSGQFVACYQLATLLGRDKWSHGDCLTSLSLDDAFPAWTVRREDLQPLFSWLKQKADQLASQRKPSLADQLNDAGARQTAGASPDTSIHKGSEEVPHDERA